MMFEPSHFEASDWVSFAQDPAVFPALPLPEFGVGRFFAMSASRS
jgi:hypothetical protein